MNLVLLMAGLRVWSGAPIEILTRVFLAISLVSIEIQIVTWAGLGTFRTLILPNVAIAALFLLWTSQPRHLGPDVEEKAAGGGTAPSPPTRHWRYLLPAALAMGVVVIFLNNVMPLTPVDPYHLERVERIERAGTIAYDPTVDRNDPRLNSLNWLYEFLIVDVKQIPVIGERLVRNHGLVGLALYALTASAMLTLLQVPPGWLAVVLLSMPLVFQQLVLIKNDLIGGLPAAVVLAWLVGRVRKAPVHEFLWAGWLAGIAVSIKLTTFPLAVVLVAGALIWRRDVRAIAALTAGGAAGAVAGGFIYTLVENVRTYGSALGPLMAVTGRPTGLADAAVSILRFTISLFDLGVLTRILWPHMTQWGGTYGLPLIWALGVLVITPGVIFHVTVTENHPQGLINAREVLVLAVVYWLLCASTNIDMGTSHRYALGPGLLLVAVAIGLASREEFASVWVRRTAIAVVVLSALQMLRSASLYLMRM
jgi:hypothetical protein